MKQSNSISNNIKLFREKEGYSQEDIAKYLGMKRELISYYETGSRKVPLDVLEKLADLFCVTLSDLLEKNSEISISNASLAFRANELLPDDLENIARFKKIVKNYLKMFEILNKNEE